MTPMTESSTQLAPLPGWQTYHGGAEVDPTLLYGEALQSGAGGEVELALGREPLSAGERDQVLLQHLPMVRAIARRIRERVPQHVELEDLVSAGTLGLIDALGRFNREKQVQFRSYAQFRVRGAMLDSLRSLDWSPRDLRRKARTAQESIRTLTQRLGRAPLEAEIAADMDLSLGEYQQLLTDLKGLELGSLNVERTLDSGEEELAYVAGPEQADPLFRCLHGEMRQRLVEALAELAEKERLVLTLYYFEELTMKEVGLTLGVVESRVSQIHSSAVLRLRVSLGLAVNHRRASRRKQ